MSERSLGDLLGVADGDAGCVAGESILDQFVERQIAGDDPAAAFPGTAIHLRGCPGCRADYEGLLDAARRFGVRPE